MNNLDFYDYSKNHPEPMIDPFYKKNVIIIDRL